MMVFAMFALQVYKGMLRQKCVLDIDYAVNVDDFTYAEHIKDEGKQLPADKSIRIFVIFEQSFASISYARITQR